MSKEMIIGFAKPFSNGSEYDVFNESYCCNCKRYKVDKEYGRELAISEGGCPIADRIGMCNEDEWPNILLLVRNAPTGIPYVHCPFIDKIKDKPNQTSIYD